MRVSARDRRSLKILLFASEIFCKHDGYAGLLKPRVGGERLNYWFLFSLVGKNVVKEDLTDGFLVKSFLTICLCKGRPAGGDWKNGISSHVDVFATVSDFSIVRIYFREDIILQWVG